MRLLQLLLAMAVWACVLWPIGTARAADTDSIERLLDAIARVESRCERDAVGDGGRAIGVYQIHRSYWQDGIRILGVNWNYRDAGDPTKARQVVRAYLQHYGQGKSLLDMARIHNGGPRGHEKKSTRDYAKKVEAILNNQARTS